MLDTLPDDIIHLIIQKIDVNPMELYEYRMINQCFYKLVTSLRNHYNPESSYVSGKWFNELCHKQITKETFEWYLQNNVQFTLPQINMLIKHNRKDLIQRGFRNSHFLKTLFNRFYISPHIKNDIFSISESQNPVIIAAINNRVEIVKLLVESCSHGNPYRINMSSLLDVGIRYNHKNIINYLVVHQFDKINSSGTFQRKAQKIINRIKNCEDLFYYCIETKKIQISQSIILGMITMDYSDLFKYSYDKVRALPYEHLSYIKQCIKEERIILFNFLLSHPTTTTINAQQFVSNYLDTKKKYSKGFIDYLNEHHLHLINKESKWIQRCIENKIENQSIFHLVEEGFHYGYDEIQIVLNHKNNVLLRYLVLHFDEKID